MRLPLELGFLHRGFWKTLRCFVPKIDFLFPLLWYELNILLLKNFNLNASIFTLAASIRSENLKNFATSFASVVDTGGKFATVVNDTAGNLPPFCHRYR